MKKIMIPVYAFLLSFLFACSAPESPDRALSARDDMFLAAMEESVLDRMKASVSKSADLTLMVDKELAYLQEYDSAEFYDAQLEGIAKKYLEGLNLQKESLSATHKWESQVEWQEGLVYRLEALKELYDEYDFLTENKDFIATYILAYDREESRLRALNSLENDVGTQMESDSFRVYWSDHDCCFEFWNNTAYQFSSVFEIRIFDRNKNLIEQQEYEVIDIRPDTGYTVSIYVEKPWEANGWEINNYYTDIVC